VQRRRDGIDRCIEACAKSTKRSRQLK
jgi:hypothetical protein